MYMLEVAKQMVCMSMSYMLPKLQGFLLICNSCNARASLQLLYTQVNKKFCQLKGGNIGIVEKAQETRFGMSPKYSRYIGIAS